VCCPQRRLLFRHAGVVVAAQLHRLHRDAAVRCLARAPDNGATVTRCSNDNDDDDTVATVPVPVVTATSETDASTATDARTIRDNDGGVGDDCSDGAATNAAQRCEADAERWTQDVRKHLVHS
jgi:hypothetical protein